MSSSPQNLHLNKPYYGPPIPPSETLTLTLAKPNFNLYSILCTITKIFTIFLIAIGIIILTLWLIYQPQSIKIYAESASLTSFNLSLLNNNTLLNYNLAINFTFRNPNRKYILYYKKIQIQTIYGGFQIGSMSLRPLRQNRKSSMSFAVRFEGRTATAAGEIFDKEKMEGFFRVRVRMYATVRLKMIVVESVKFKPDVDCDLRVPAPGNFTSLGIGFRRTECDVKNFS